MSVVSIKWFPEASGSGGHLELLDQTKLPLATHWIKCSEAEVVVEAIKRLAVRGAPAIGIAGAYAYCLAAQQAIVDTSGPDGVPRDCRGFTDRIVAQAALIAAARPTAVNLQWAVDRMNRVLSRFLPDSSRTHDEGAAVGGASLSAGPAEILLALCTEAVNIHQEDEHLCRLISRIGAQIMPKSGDVLTHCNTGCLATGGEGTALGVIACAYKQRPFTVYADETRPLLQGSRLTAWELKQLGIPVRVLCDSAAAALLESGRVGAVIVGADRITSNGDVANKIGTYGLAILANFHNVPFFVAAPFSSFDLTIASGKEIVIEQRVSTEVTRPMDVQAAPVGVDAFNPAFDVTPARLVHSIITERGVVHPVTADNIRSIAANDRVQKVLGAIADGSSSAEMRAQHQHALALLYEPYGGL